MSIWNLRRCNNTRRVVHMVSVQNHLEYLPIVFQVGQVCNAFYFLLGLIAQQRALECVHQTQLHLSFFSSAPVEQTQIAKQRDEMT